MATSSFQDAADASEIAKKIVDTSESSDGEISECGSVYSVETLLVQPSSAAYERVFSLLNSSFSSQQQSSLQGYIEALMLQYNYR